MKDIKIRLDYLHGPIWKDKIDITSGEMRTGVECIDKDITLQTLNDGTFRVVDEETSRLQSKIAV